MEESESFGRAGTIEEIEPLAVGAFLDVLNESFVGMRISIRGEVSGIEDRRNVVYFSLKDSNGDGMLSCLMFRNDFLIHGSDLREGQEIIVEGAPNIWKPRGKLSFRVSVVRLAGAGALKRAYDELRKNLELEGLFLPERKRGIPPFPRKVALITSRDGAAIGDFSANLGRYGFSVSLFDAHVEGKRSVGDIISGIEFFNRHPKSWDALVLIRGGGSLESLEAFNSEPVVRAFAGSHIPTIAGIGHEKDVPLAALVADVMVSTPTAAAKAISFSEESARETMDAFSRSISESFRRQLFENSEKLWNCSNALRRATEKIVRMVQDTDRVGIRISSMFSSWCEQTRIRQHHLSREFLRETDPSSVRRRIDDLHFKIEARNPNRLFERGYAVIRRNRQVVRSVESVSVGESFEVVLSDGNIGADVTRVTPSGH